MAAYGFIATVGAGKVTGTLSNFTAVLTQDNFPIGSMDGGANSILNGGGNLRCYTDETKTTQVPIELPVPFVTGVTPSCVVWLLHPSISVGDTVYIEADTVATTQPIDSDTYGGEKVWVDYATAITFGDTTTIKDSTGNVTPTLSGTLTNDVDSNGLGVSFSNALITVPDSADLVAASGTASTIDFFTLKVTDIAAQAVAERGVNGAHILQVSGVAPNGHVITAAGMDNAIGAADVAETPTSEVGTGYKRYIATYDGSVNKLYQNGVLVDTSSPVAAISRTSSPLTIGSRSGSSPFSGSLSQYAIRAGTITQDEITATEKNQSDPSTFWVTGAWEEQGSVTLDILPLPTQVTSTSTPPTINTTSNVLVSTNTTESISEVLNASVALSVPINLTSLISESLSEGISPSLLLNYTVELIPNTSESTVEGITPNVSLAATVGILPITSENTSESILPSVSLTSNVGIQSTLSQSTSGSLSASVILGSTLSILQVTTLSEGSSDNPVLDLSSLVELSTNTTESISLNDNPTISLSTPLTLQPVVSNSNSIATASTILLLDTIRLQAGITDSIAETDNPSVSTTSTTLLSPSTTEALTSTDNPSILLASTLKITTNTSESSSSSESATIDLVVELVVTPKVTESTSTSDNPFILIGQKLTIESFTIKYADQTILAEYAPSSINISYGE